MVLVVELLFGVDGNLYERGRKVADGWMVVLLEVFDSIQILYSIKFIFKLRCTENKQFGTQSSTFVYRQMQSTTTTKTCGFLSSKVNRSNG